MRFLRRLKEYRLRVVNLLARQTLEAFGQRKQLKRHFLQRRHEALDAQETPSPVLIVFWDYAPIHYQKLGDLYPGRLQELSATRLLN
jgi:hypothetical protein